MPSGVHSCPTKQTRAEFAWQAARIKRMPGSKGGNTMLRFMLPVVATTAFIVSATSAFALESNVTVKSSMPPQGQRMKSCRIRGRMIGLQDQQIVALARQDLLG